VILFSTLEFLFDFDLLKSLKINKIKLFAYLPTLCVNALGRVTANRQLIRASLRCTTQTD
ncbi:hypothetical protein, partial [Bartonella sp. CL48QHWL]|uniref:hypothetical protein n=1 Tax=Bartonella sp. CL48QHWL TaxID=3243535 RepID=UPI0035CF992E